MQRKAALWIHQAMLPLPTFFAFTEHLLRPSREIAGIYKFLQASILIWGFRPGSAVATVHISSHASRHVSDVPPEVSPHRRGPTSRTPDASSTSLNRAKNREVLLEVQHGGSKSSVSKCVCTFFASLTRSYVKNVWWHRFRCETCRRRKVKCSGEQPCRACIKHNWECIFGHTGRRRYSEACVPGPFSVLANTDRYSSQVKQLLDKIRTYEERLASQPEGEPDPRNTDNHKTHITSQVHLCLRRVLRIQFRANCYGSPKL
jgi:hypothetical protein